MWKYTVIMFAFVFGPKEYGVSFDIRKTDFNIFVPFYTFSSSFYSLNALE